MPPTIRISLEPLDVRTLMRSGGCCDPGRDIGYLSSNTVGVASPAAPHLRCAGFEGG